MLSKSLDEWLKEVTHYSAFYYERYAQALEDHRFSNEAANCYCRVAAKYYDLRRVLYHIKTYNKIIDKENCTACKNDHSDHIPVIDRTYNQYKRWIDQLVPSKKN